MKKEMGSILRELREKSNYTVKQVIDKLKEHGIEISDKALYSYESNKRAVSADTFLVLCKIYNCKNILETFSGIELDYSIPDDREWKIIEKYRTIAEHSPKGKESVDYILNREYELAKDIAQKVEKATIYTFEPQPTSIVAERSIEYNAKAARNDYEDEPGEQEKMQSDIANLKRPE